MPQSNLAEKSATIDFLQLPEDQESTILNPGGPESSEVMIDPELIALIKQTEARVTELQYGQARPNGIDDQLLQKLDSYEPAILAQLGANSHIHRQMSRAYFELKKLIPNTTKKHTEGDANFG